MNWNYPCEMGWMSCKIGLDELELPLGDWLDELKFPL
jgi:hypothetical protein